MTVEIWTAYVGTVLLLMATPGPSHLLMMSNALANGFPRATATAAGDLTANVGQMLLAGLGLAAAVAATEYGLLAIKWAGVAFLVWRGVVQIRQAARPRAGAEAGRRASLRQLWLQGFVTSAANPKAVVFFAALFPLFLRPEAPLWPQLALLGATYLAIDGAFLCSYGLAGPRIVRLLGGGATETRLRLVTGGLLILAALLLGLKPV